VRAEHDADGLRSSAIMRLLLTNAYRCRDMLGAQIEDLGEDRGHRTLGTTVKGGHRVKDAIPPPTARAIDVYLASRGGPTSGPIFATRTGRPMDNGGLAKLLRRLCLQAGVPVISPHGGRKTAITEALVTVGLRGAQDLAHHADPRTTRIYDAARGELDDHPAYVLATRYGSCHKITSVGAPASNGPPEPGVSILDHPEQCGRVVVVHTSVIPGIPVKTVEKELVESLRQERGPEEIHQLLRLRSVEAMRVHRSLLSASGSGYN
jgi:hypothetical protein